MYAGILFIYNACIGSRRFGNRHRFSDAGKWCCDPCFLAAGYTENVIQFSGPAGSQDLGAIDLSKYGSVTIEYGSDGGAIFEGDSAQAYLAITENGPVQDGSGAALSDAKIIGKVDLEDQSNGGWATANTEVTIPFNSNYNGNVYVALFAVTKAGVAPNGNFDALAITKITFHEKTGSETPTRSYAFFSGARQHRSDGASENRRRQYDYCNRCSRDCINCFVPDKENKDLIGQLIFKKISEIIEMKAFR